MKKRVFIFPALIIVTFFGGLAWGQGAVAPEIFFKEKAFSAGEVLEGVLIEHTYTVYNKGNAELDIQKVRTG